MISYLATISPVRGSLAVQPSLLDAARDGSADRDLFLFNADPRLRAGADPDRLPWAIPEVRMRPGMPQIKTRNSGDTSPSTGHRISLAGNPKIRASAVRSSPATYRPNQSVPFGAGRAGSEGVVFGSGRGVLDSARFRRGGRRPHEGAPGGRHPFLDWQWLSFSRSTRWREQGNSGSSRPSLRKGDQALPTHYLIRVGGRQRGSGQKRRVSRQSRGRAL